MEKIESSYGALFPNQKRKKSRSPQMLGSIFIDHYFFVEMIDHYEDTGKIEIQISAWKNSCSETGVPYLTLKAKLPFVKKRSIDDDKTDAFQFLADL
jgi:hypothetical protein